ncbi:MAG: hypothetical protein ACRCXY_11365, partial [Fusobacteriaceae bacterium]
MSMSLEHIQEVMDKPAVACCRTEAGTIIGAANLEDPAIFPDMEDSGLLTIPGNCLKVKNVLGAKLIKTIDSLTALTPDLLEGITEDKSDEKVEECVECNEEKMAVLKINKKSGDVITLSDLEEESNIANLTDSLLVDLNRVLRAKEVVGKTIVMDIPALTGLTPVHFGEKEIEETVTMTNNIVTCNGGVLKIKIGEGKNIDIELPLFGGNAMSAQPSQSTVAPSQVKIEKKMEAVATAVAQEVKKVRTLTKKHFKIEKVEFAKETKIEGTTLFIREDVIKDAVNPLVVSVKLDIITPDKYNTYSETIMDVQPVVTKEGEDKLGSGVSRVLDGVVMMVTGTDENGVQIGEFGSSEGILEENISWGRPGAPDRGDIIIK